MNRLGKLGFLVFSLAVCGGATIVSHLLQVQNDQVRPAELYSVVSSQLAAVREDDYPRAYQHASATVREKLNIQQFADSIRSDLVGISRIERVEFGAYEHRGRKALIQVFFFNRDGNVIPCVYSLIREGDSWKIDGARAIRRWPGNASLGGIKI